MTKQKGLQDCPCKIFALSWTPRPPTTQSATLNELCMHVKVDKWWCPETSCTVARKGQNASNPTKECNAAAFIQICKSCDGKVEQAPCRTVSFQNTFLALVSDCSGGTGCTQTWKHTSHSAVTFKARTGSRLHDYVIVMISSSLEADIPKLGECSTT